MTREPHTRTVGKRGVGHIAHFVGNVLLGISLGLFSYYWITNVLAASAQSGLEEELTAMGPIALAVPPVEPTEAGEPELTGWETWAQEDLAYWEGLSWGDIFGRLVIPRIDADMVVVTGTEREHLKKGPGWMTETDPPGATGNTGISGHRTTYGAPFRRINELQPGDEIQFYSPYRRYTYEVVEQFVVRPDQTEVVASTAEPMLTLSACHPLYSARSRIVVQARLVEMRLLKDGGGTGG